MGHAGVKRPRGRWWAFCLAACLFGLFAAPLAAQDGGRQALYEDARARTATALSALDADPADRRRALVELAGALKALRFAEAEARLDKADPPAGAALRPGEAGPPSVEDVVPAGERVRLSGVGDVWFAYRLERAERALLDALAVVETAPADARARLALVAAHLDALTRPPPAWRVGG